MAHVYDNDIDYILVKREQLAQRVKELGEEITRDYEGKEIVLVCILKGSVVFYADLMRNINLNMNLDFSYRNQNALCRNIKTMATQATSGNRAVKLAFSADYIYSKMLTLNFYYDFQSNFPLVSTSSYPTATHDCGITLKFSLTR